MRILKLIASLIIAFSASAIGGLATSQNISGWYEALEKPFFNPPNWVFAPVWTVLYALIGISLYLIWSNESKITKGRAYLIFAVQLGLNTLWSIVFFGLHQTWWGLFVVMALLISIVFNLLIFKKISKLAGYLLTPYLLWVSFATCLNLAIAILN